MISTVSILCYPIFVCSDIRFIYKSGYLYMKDNLKIEFLQDNPHLFPILEELYRTEWKEYYGPYGQGDALFDIKSFCNTSHLPIGLVALKQGDLYGSVALRQNSASHPHLSPWVTSLFVIPGVRRMGIGTKLIDAVEKVSITLGFKKIYARSKTAVDFFLKNKWVPFDRNDELNLTIFNKGLKP
jgi:GNAT superfamily N-acetyltransferase